ncbi:MAG: ATP-binding protein [Alphaproteobacteria bacterium]|nr:ATP-binding protein [Alphaproteobacteria bacterium]
MPLFTKPINALTADDIRAIKGRPEDFEADFKEALPGKGPDNNPNPEGMPPPAGRFTDSQRNELAADVVAFLNTEGGHIVIGVEELPPENGQGKSNRAGDIKPIAECTVLADKLRQALMDVIDPHPPAKFDCRGIVTEDDKSSGVIVVYAPRSLAAPHRRTSDNHFFKRLADRTMKMSAADVTDLAVRRRQEQDTNATASSEAQRKHDEAVERIFQERAKEAQSLLSKRTGAFQLLRVTAVPARPLHEIDVGIFDARAFPQGHYHLAVVEDGRRRDGFEAQDVYMRDLRGAAPSPMLDAVTQEGTAEFYGDEFKTTITSSGVIEYRSCNGKRNTLPEGQQIICVEWFVARVMNVLVALHRLRENGALRDVPHCVEVRFAQVGGTAMFRPFLSGSARDMWWKRFLERLPDPLPPIRCSVEGPETFNDALSRIVNKLYDAAGIRQETRLRVEADWNAILAKASG